MREVMQRFRPDVVFHAAAYKHVSLTEDNPLEALRNNAIGTRVVATAAARGGRRAGSSWSRRTRRSTRRPRSARRRRWRSGSSRRGAIVIQRQSFCCVRFGNVLGSSGSVVPLFRRQIEQGGPVTVTHPDMERYFMTVPEAVQLIIRAGNLATGGEVFVLEMGEQVRIVDLARNMIRLSGQQEGATSRSRSSARARARSCARSSSTTTSGPVPTAADKILKAERPALEPEWVEAVFERIERLVEQGDETFLAQHLSELAKSARASIARDLKALAR